MTVPRPPRCARHPTVPAGWRCEGCRRTLCPECVEARRMSTVDLLVCRACGDRAETLLRHRSESHPRGRWLVHALHAVLGREGLVLMVSVGSMLAALDFFAELSFILLRGFPLFLAAGLFWGCFFSVLRAGARAETHLTQPEFSEVLADWLMPAFRGFLATSAAWLPVGVYLVFFSGWDVNAYLDREILSANAFMGRPLKALPWSVWMRDPLAWALALTGLAYVPIGLMMASTGTPLLELLDPRRNVRALSRLGRDYAVTLALLSQLGVAFIASLVCGTWFRELHWPLLSRWVYCLLLLPLPLLMAHVLGSLLFTRGDVLGYGAPGDYLVPVLPGQAPSTTLRVEHLGTPAPDAGPPREQRIQELTAAVDARDVPRALALYTTEPVLPGAALPPAVHLFIGQAAASQEQYPLAVRALEAAADRDPEDPLAPRALVLLARVFGERMHEPTRAQEIYRYIVERYPETDASRFARVRLPPTT